MQVEGFLDVEQVAASSQVRAPVAHPGSMARSRIAEVAEKPFLEAVAPPAIEQQIADIMRKGFRLDRAASSPSSHETMSDDLTYASTLMEDSAGCSVQAMLLDVVAAADHGNAIVPPTLSNEIELPCPEQCMIPLADHL